MPINDISDHLPVFLFFENFSINKRNNFKHSKETRLINNVNIASFRSALSEQSWTSVYDSDNVDLVKLDNKIYGKPWITLGLRNACLKKNILYKRFLKIRISEANQRYKVYKNKLTSVLRYCENDYYKKRLGELRYDTSEIWKIMNSVLKRKIYNSVLVEKFKTDDNKIITGKTEVAIFSQILGQN